MNHPHHSKTRLFNTTDSNGNAFTFHLFGPEFMKEDNSYSYFVYEKPPELGDEFWEFRLRINETEHTLEIDMNFDHFPNSLKHKGISEALFHEAAKNFEMTIVSKYPMSRCASKMWKRFCEADPPLAKTTEEGYRLLS